MTTRKTVNRRSAPLSNFFLPLGICFDLCRDVDEFWLLRSRCFVLLSILLLQEVPFSFRHSLELWVIPVVIPFYYD
jgi:hypothetical protein